MDRLTNIINWREPAIEQRIIRNAPIDWRTEFQNDNPIDLEIGIGNGSFLVPFANDHPDRNIIGIEIDGLYLKKADRKLVRQNISNARLIIGDAKLLVWSLIGDETIDNLYVHFPDPWFKKRHIKRRMINAITLRLFARKIRSALTVSTDDPEYKDWVLECVPESGCFENAFTTPWVESLDGHYMTKYEKKWRAEGKPIYFMKFLKSNQPAINTDEYILSQNLGFPISRLQAKYEMNPPSMISNL
jgi:tRNA (guanine-N7-)-methyltransferase